MAPTQMAGAGLSILSYFTRHRTVANLLLVLMLAGGLFAFPQMRAQFFPDVIVDNVTVSVSWKGAGAEDVDRAIVQVMEPALLAVEGVSATSSTSSEGSARITLDFDPGWDMARAADDVQGAVDGVAGNLPDDADDPNVRRGAWRDRVTDVVITGPVGVDQLGRFADEFVTRLFSEGVTRTTIRGVAAGSTVVEVPSLSLIRHDVTMAQIAEAIAEEAVVDPAGDVSGSARVRTGVAKRGAGDIGNIVLRSNEDGSKLRIADVATVTEEGIDRNRAYFVGTEPAISIRIDRSDDGDAIDIQAQVEEVAADLEATLPEQVSVDLIRTRAEAITGRLNILFDNGLMGLALVVLLLFLFLNARTAFWVAAGIPVAMAAAIGLMFAFGLTLNMISLFALIITLGIVVDDAIVVGEHADFRARELGEPPVEAAENAARRMFLPVFSATITTVIAFYGLTIIGGRFGDFIADIPFTVVAVLIASLIECFLILPNHMSHAIGKDTSGRFSGVRFVAGVVFLPLFFGLLLALGWSLWRAGALPALDTAFAGLVAQGAAAAIAVGVAFCAISAPGRARLVRFLGSDWYDAPSRVVNRGFVWAREKIFRRAIRLVLRLRYPVVAFAILALASQVTLLISGEVRWRFFNAPERGSVTGNFAMAPGATREDSLEMMLELQDAVERTSKDYEERFGVSPVSYVLAEIGGNSGRGLAGASTKDADQLGAISIELIDADLRPYSSFAFLADLQDAVRRHPLVETVSFRGWRSGPGGDALDVQLYGADAQTLKDASEALQTALAQYGEVSALQDNLAYDKEELILDLTPQGQALGFTIDGLGRVLRNRLNGIEAASFPDGPRSATIRVELPRGELTADFLDRTQLRAAGGAYVPLADIVTVERRTGFSTVRRENGLQQISVSGDISEDDPARATEIMVELEEQILPRIAEEYGVATRFSGLAEQENEFLSDATLGLYMVLLGIFLTLAWIFGSWTRPVVVMAIIPFGLIGTIYGHLVWEVPLSMFSVIGLIGMVGIIINDSIVLVTTIDEHARTKGHFEAIVDGTCDRLRPVLLTTLTTVLGLTPLLYEGSSQAEFLKPTVITLVFGLGAGMFLVLLIVPSIMAMQQDVSGQLRAARRALRLGRRAPAVGAAMVASALGGLALFAATLGAVAVTGALPAAFAALPMASTSPVLAALGAFVVGSAAILVTVYVLVAVGLGLSRGLRRA